jgi:peroxiredoxin
MHSLKYVFVALFLFTFLSFVGEKAARSSKGLHEGNTAPEFTLSDLPLSLQADKYAGQYILLNFWASYDACSRMTNIRLSNNLKKDDRKNVVMLSVSFDEFESVFKETIKADELDTTNQFQEITGKQSPLYKKFQLQKGFTNYLLDKSGKIIAQGVNPSDLEMLLRN